MPLSSFFQRFTRREQGPAVQAQALSQTEIEQARVRARRRMIGMAVLVAVGVVGFSWLFETQPRPMRPDVVVVSKAASSGVRSGMVAPEVSAPAVPPAVSRALDAERSEALARVDTAPAVTESREPREEIIEDAPAAAVAQPKPAPKPPAPKPLAKPAVKPAEPAKPAKPASTLADPPGTRYIVQVGAFSDGPTAHAARMKVERLGIKTYTQAITTPQGKRIRVRVGPYTNKADADKAMASIRKAGLNGALLTL